MTRASSKRRASLSSFLSETNVEDIVDPFLFPDPPTPKRKRANTGFDQGFDASCEEYEASISNEHRKKRRRSSPLVPSPALDVVPIVEPMMLSGVQSTQLFLGLKEPTPPKDVTNVDFSHSKSSCGAKLKTISQPFSEDGVVRASYVKRTKSSSKQSRPPRGDQQNRKASPFVVFNDFTFSEAPIVDSKPEADREIKKAGFSSKSSGDQIRRNQVVNEETFREYDYSFASSMSNQAHRLQQVNETKNAAERYAQVRNAVRKFCKLPPTERTTSLKALEYSQTIEDISGGYRLVSQFQREQLRRQNFEIHNKHELAQALEDNKRFIFQSMAPVINYLEKEKAKETSRIQDFTNCRVDRKGASYRYVDIVSGEPVRGSEYEKRYLHAIGSIPLRSKDTSNITAERLTVLESCKQNKQGSQLTGQVALHTLTNSAHPSIVESSSNDAEESSKITPPARKKLESSARVQQSNDEASSDMSECMTPISPPSSPEPVQIKYFPIFKSTNDLTISSAMNIPLKNEVSSHPEIASAQRKLWAAMDRALEEYSSTVMEIHIREQQHLLRTVRLERE